VDVLQKPIDAEGKIEYDALGDGVTFWMAPIERDTEITGPMAAKLFISSSTEDSDLFLIVRVFDPKNPAPRAQMLDGFNEGWIEFENGEHGSLKGQTEIETVLRQLVARG
jgi:hypothetical protein